MLRPDLVDRIEAMVRDGRWSLRAIARHLGVARGSVLAISRGKYRRRAASLPGADGGLPASDGPYVRCPRCGHRIQMPCLICRLRDRTKETLPRPASRVEAPGVTVGLQLTGEHLLRYREVRLRRIREAKAAEERARRRRARRLRLLKLASMTFGSDWRLEDRGPCYVDSRPDQGVAQSAGPAARAQPAQLADAPATPT